MQKDLCKEVISYNVTHTCEKLQTENKDIFDHLIHIFRVFKLKRENNMLCDGNY